MSSPQEPLGATAGSNPEPPTPAKPTALTEYLVLSKEAGFWTEQDKAFSRSAKAAITAYVSDNKLAEGMFVAVPARSWQPVTVKTETVQKLTLT